jgi:hypothetical protein
MKKLIATASLLILFPMLALAQSAPSADHAYRGDGYLFFGLGNGTNYAINGRAIGSAVVEQVGGGGEVNLYSGFGVAAELGYAHWSQGPSGAAWTPSGDLLLHFKRNKTRGLVDPFVFGGVSGYIPTTYGARGSWAVNFGGGVNLWFSKHTALRLEFRDYATTSSHDLQPGGNYASFRVGVTFR